mmetsp:Transcript_16236/g.53049  ORF Transcript_16236/g.53049 Transcript_16236/m.53049 type:complete len:309 (-) Transcript_16236:2288-3214(-)
MRVLTRELTRELSGPKLPSTPPQEEVATATGEKEDVPAEVEEVVAKEEAEEAEEGTGDSAELPPPPAVLPPPCVPEAMYSSPGASGFKLRAPSYLRDCRKQPAPAPEIFSLDLVELFESETPIAPVCGRAGSRLPLATAPLSFVMNLQVPVAPAAAGKTRHRSLVSFWSLSPAAATSLPPPFARLLAVLLSGDAATRSNLLKLVPRVVEGSWVVRNAVGSRPFMIGHKLQVTYHSGPGWLEACVDLGSSPVARAVIGLLLPITERFVVDLGVVLEGHRDEELPEYLLGTVRFSRIDMSIAATVLASEE